MCLQKDQDGENTLRSKQGLSPLRGSGAVYRLSEDVGQDLFTLRRYGTGFIVSEKMWGRIYCLSEEEQGLLSLRGYGAGSVIS